MADVNDSIEMLDDISRRADAMNLRLVKYPVEDVRAVLAEVRRLRMRASVPAPAAAQKGDEP